jgi:hypothetical protein
VTRAPRRLPLSDGTPLGALLLAKGLVTEAQLDAALVEQEHGG